MIPLRTCSKEGIPPRRSCLIGPRLAVYLGAVLFFLATAAHAQDVIVNPGVTAESISHNALRAIFAMRLRTWPDGSEIFVFVLPEQSETHVRFTKHHLDVFPHQLTEAWERLVYSGTGQAPIRVRTLDEMKRSVAQTRGGIGYLPKEKIDASVRVLEIR